jgi:hypothetical protein
MGLSLAARKSRRPFWAPLTVCLAIVILGTAEPAGQTAFNPDRGVGGYEGSIIEIRQPVDLRVGAANAVEGRLQLTHADPSLMLPKHNDVRIQGTVRPEGAAFRFEATVPELLIEGRRLPLPGTLLAVRGLMDVRGAWNETEIDPLPQIRTADKGKLIPVGGHLIGRKLATGPVFAGRPIRTGDEMFASRELDRRLTVTEGEDYAVARNTLSARARGLTEIAGRSYVVGAVSGTIDIVGKNGDAYQIAPRGHVLIDRATGLPRGVMRLAMTGSEGGRPVNRTADLTFELAAK